LSPEERNALGFLYETVKNSTVSELVKARLPSIHKIGLNMYTTINQNSQLPPQKYEQWYRQLLDAIVSPDKGIKDYFSQLVQTFTDQVKQSLDRTKTYKFPDTLLDSTNKNNQSSNPMQSSNPTQSSSPMQSSNPMQWMQNIVTNNQTNVPNTSSVAEGLDKISDLTKTDNTNQANV
jgi:hypothetical protein